MVSVDKNKQPKQFCQVNGREGPETLSGLKHLIYSTPRDGTPDPMAVLPSIRWLAQSLTTDK